MQDIIHSAAGPVKRIEIEQIGFVEVNTMQHFSQIVALAGREIVESSNFLASRQQSPRQGGPDEACNAGDKISCHKSP